MQLPHVDHMTFLSKPETFVINGYSDAVLHVGGRGRCLGPPLLELTAGWNHRGSVEDEWPNDILY